MSAAFVRLCTCRICSSDVSPKQSSSLFSRKGLKEDLPGCLSRLLLVPIEDGDGLPHQDDYAISRTANDKPARKVWKRCTSVEQPLILTEKTSVLLEVARKRAISSKSPSKTILSRTRHFPYSRTFFPKVGQALGIVILLFKLNFSG